MNQVTESLFNYDFPQGQLILRQQITKMLIQLGLEISSALERYFPQEATWTIPNGGLFLWVQLPSEVSMVLIARQAWLENVFVYPGMPFFPGQKGYNALRLNFSHNPETIEKGIAILGKLLKQHLQK